MAKRKTQSDIARIRHFLNTNLKGRYLIVERMPEGGTGILFKLRERSTGIFRVAKVLSPKASAVPQLRKEFLLEATKLANLRHANLVNVIEAFVHGRHPYFVMEYVPGSPLNKIAKKLAQKYPQGKWISYLQQVFIQLADVLNYLHQRKKPLLHLDIKPENIIVDEDLRGDLRPILLDFGLSRFEPKKNVDPKKTTAFGTFHMWPQRYHSCLEQHTHTGRTIFLINRSLLNPDLDLHLLGKTMQIALMAAYEADRSNIARWDENAKSQYQYLYGLTSGLLIDKQEHPFPPTSQEVLSHISRARHYDHRAREQFGRGFLRLPAVNLTNFGAKIRGLADWPKFQRLRGINQLGFTSMVYPGANHTRFEHSLGVFENTIDVLDHLVSSSGDHRFRSMVSDDELVATCIAALYHDIGHYPFIHQFRVRGTYPEHEERSLEIIKSGECEELVKKDFGEEVYKALRAIFSFIVASELGKEEKLDGYERPVHYKVLKEILSGSIDVDKLDYINRDSIHAGVPYGTVVDRARLVSSLRIWWSPKDIPELVLSDKGRACAEALVFGRYLMFSEVYWNHCVRAFGAMLSAVMHNFSDEEVSQHLWDTDSQFLSWLDCTNKASWFMDLYKCRRPYRRAFVQQRAGRSEDTKNTDQYLFLKIESAAKGNKDDLRVLREVVSTALGIKRPKAHEIIIDVPAALENVTGIRILPEGGQEPISPGPIFQATGANFDSFARKGRVFVHPKYMDGRSLIDTNTAIRTLLKSRFVID